MLDLGLLSSGRLGGRRRWASMPGRCGLPCAFETAGLSVSAWLAQAAERAAAAQVTIADGLAAIAEFEAEAWYPLTDGTVP